MGFLVMSIVIVKEGGLSKLLETLLVVVLGTTISNLVCFTLSPHSATSKLKKDINETLTSFSTLLSILSQTFLLDPSPSPLTLNAEPTTASTAASKTPQTLASAVSAHEKSFKSLKTNLAEAKSEFLDPRIQRTGKAYDAVVDSLTRLAQHLTGMRSGTGLQVELMSAQREGRIVLGEGKEELKSPRYSPAVMKEKGGGAGRRPGTTDYFDHPGERVVEQDVGEGGGEDEDNFDEEDRKLAEDANLFAEVREHVGPQLRELTVSPPPETRSLLRPTFSVHVLPSSS